MINLIEKAFSDIFSAKEWYVTCKVKDFGSHKRLVVVVNGLGLSEGSNQGIPLKDAENVQLFSDRFGVHIHTLRT